MDPVSFYPHQVEAISWMSRIENRPRFVREQPQGGILAHAMGLGKTASMLGLINQSDLRLTLVVCPKSVLQQWREEALRVTRFTPDVIVVYHGANRLDLLQQTSHAARLVLTTFDIVRREHMQLEDGATSASAFASASASNPALTPAATLFSVHWDRVAVDEAHHICEQGSKTAKAMRALRSPNRWCITGTPFKNGVADLVALAKFLCVAPYSDPSWWRVYSKNSRKLCEWREAFLNMNTKDTLDLPRIHARTLDCVSGSTEKRLFKALNTTSGLRVPGVPGVPGENSCNSGGADDWSAQEVPNGQQHELLKILRLRQVANHPLMLVPTQTAKHLCSPERGTAGVCGGCGSADPRESSPLCSEHLLCNACRNQNIMCPLCLVQSLPRSGDWPHSSKTRALWDYVRRYPDAKMVIFSQWTTCLDLLSTMFAQMGVDAIRFDGRVNSLEERSEIIAEFHVRDECKILLTSLGAGGEGLNLTCATHVLLMEPYWNSAVEQQAVDRVHRIGQTREVHVGRFILDGKPRADADADANNTGEEWSDDAVERWVLEIQNFKNQELDRLLWGKEPTAGDVKHAIRRRGANNCAQKVTGDAVPTATARMKFNESPQLDATAPGEAPNTAGNLLRFLRVGVGTKRAREEEMK